MNEQLGIHKGKQETGHSGDGSEGSVVFALILASLTFWRKLSTRLLAYFKLLIYKEEAMKTSATSNEVLSPSRVYVCK